MSKDSRGRSLAKTALYRVWAIALLAAISYYFTGNAGEATTITVLFNLGATVAYYGLERLWQSLDWGRSASESKPTPSSWLSRSVGSAAEPEDSKPDTATTGLKNKAA